MLILSGCAAERGTNSPQATAGVMEVAVSETCTADTKSECVALNGEHLRFATADSLPEEIEEVSVTEDQLKNSVVIVHSDVGSTVLESCTAEVMQSGDDAFSAVTVAEAPRSRQFQLTLPAEATVEEFLEWVREGPSSDYPWVDSRFNGASGRRCRPCSSKWALRMPGRRMGQSPRAPSDAPAFNVFQRAHRPCIPCLDALRGSR